MDSTIVHKTILPQILQIPAGWTGPTSTIWLSHVHCTETYVLSKPKSSLVTTKIQRQIGSSDEWNDIVIKKMLFLFNFLWHIPHMDNLHEKNW